VAGGAPARARAADGSPADVKVLLRTGNKTEVCGVVEGTGKARYRWCLFFVLVGCLGWSISWV
jgi:hypothetical protein